MDKQYILVVYLGVLALGVTCGASLASPLGRHVPGGPVVRDVVGTPGPSLAWPELLPYNPVANESSVVVSGDARFTVLTERMIRIEWAIGGKFEDRATLAVLNRNMATLPTFSQKSAGGTLTIATAGLQLQYTEGKPFAPDTLSITLLPASKDYDLDEDAPQTLTTWTYGETNEGTSNLFGTIKSLDQVGPVPLNCTENANITVHQESLHCAWGLVARSGWAILDDTDSPALDPVSGWWGVGNNTDAVDIYFFGHGLEYTAAISDYMLIGGKVAMVPRYALGIWWSRWQNIANRDTRLVVDAYAQRDLPLDVYILDMDWHSKQAWGGYTIDYSLFPYPSDSFGWIHQQGLALAGNLHDQTGLNNWEETWDAVCKKMGVDPSTTKTIPFSMTNETYSLAVEDIALLTLEQTHNMSNFWWIDYQQGGTQGNCTGGKMNPTIWTDKLRCTDKIRRGDNSRAMVLARWGGMGNHRYQVGFSGDVKGLTWTNLAFQPYFSLTAANVGYGFWSHDLVGPAEDMELYTRWLQWGAYSGIMRSHDRGMASGHCNFDNWPVTIEGCPRVEVWNTPQFHFAAIRSAMRDRAELIPYMYNALAQAFATGVGLMRPMYYEFPSADMAYAASPNGTFAQYFFGADMIVSPVTIPGSLSNTTGDNTTLATWPVWVPPGTWVDRLSGAVVTGAAETGTVRTRAYGLQEVPILVRAGAIIPRIALQRGDTIATARRQYTALVWEVYPGAASGTVSLYEDDGETTDYLSGKWASTAAAFNWTSTGLSFRVSATQGTYPGLPSTRPHTLKVVNGVPPSSVTVNGKALTYSRFGAVQGSGTWAYDGDTASLLVHSETMPTNADVAIDLAWASDVAGVDMAGVRGGVQRSNSAKYALDQTKNAPDSNSVGPGYLNRAASQGDALSYLAGADLKSFAAQVKAYPTLLKNAHDEIVSTVPTPPETQAQYAEALMVDPMN